MISKQEKQQIKHLVTSPQWGAIENLAADICVKLSNEQAIKDTEWETIQTMLVLEGQKRGIKRFLQEITEQAFHE